MPRSCWWLAWAACRADGALDDPPPPADASPPVITDVDLECSRRDGTWRAQVTTDAWAGGAVLLWTVDGDYLELQSGFRSVRAAEDGTSDELRADLRIVDDFRPAGEGGNTAFTCRDSVSALLWVQALDLTVADCVQLGPVTAPLLSQPDVPACPRVWTPEDDPDTPGAGEP